MRTFVVSACVAAVIAVIAALCPAPAEAGIVVTVEDPKVQSTSVSGVTTENFDSLPTGSHSTLATTIGTFTSTSMRVVNADVYGGAGRVGKYFTITVPSSITLTLNAYQSYFGFWWSAADTRNVVEFYSGDTLLGTFKSATALSALSSAYNGNPNPPGGNNNDKYAYVNFFGTDGTTFDRIVFSGNGFEMDNLSIRAIPITPPFPGTVIPGATIVATPEPTTLAGFGLGAMILWAAKRRGGKKAATQ